MMLCDLILYIAPSFFSYLCELDGLTLEIKDYVLFISEAKNWAESGLGFSKRPPEFKNALHDVQIAS